MNTSLFSLMLTYIGALVFWFFKGMKSPLRLETSGRLDRDFKYFRNFITGLIMFILFLLILYKIIN